MNPGGESPPGVMIQVVCGSFEIDNVFFFNLSLSPSSCVLFFYDPCFSVIIYIVQDLTIFVRLHSCCCHNALSSLGRVLPISLTWRCLGTVGKLLRDSRSRIHCNEGPDRKEIWISSTLSIPISFESPWYTDRQTKVAVHRSEQTSAIIT